VAFKAAQKLSGLLTAIIIHNQIAQKILQRSKEISSFFYKNVFLPLCSPSVIPFVHYKAHYDPLISVADG